MNRSECQGSHLDSLFERLVDVFYALELLDIEGQQDIEHPRHGNVFRLADRARGNIDNDQMLNELWVEVCKFDGHFASH